MEKSHPSKDILGSKSTKLYGKRVALCITGSIALTTAPKVARELMRMGAEVFPVMSPMAQKMLNPDVLEWATGNKPVVEMNGSIDFLSLTESSGKVDLVLIAPATLNTIGKLASGINDTPVTALVLAAYSAGIPILVVPAMHKVLYEYPINKDNIEKLKKLGFEFIEPRIEEGKAKIADVEVIVEAVVKRLAVKDMDGLKVLVAAGPTYEYIDPIRIITNKSSGRMGVALASEASRRGAEVTLIYGPGIVRPPTNIKVVNVETSNEMADTVLSQLKSENYHLFISAAAVADFTPIESYNQKVSTDDTLMLDLKLKPTLKIVKEAKKVSPKTFVVGFKAEYNLSDEELVERAYKRLKSANIDLIVANDVGRKNVGFRHETNEVLVVDKNKSFVKLPMARKEEIAEKILDIVLEKMGIKGEIKT
ncbi:MAG: bifunctional phosphopantothenoylcysteine decarboxylase/phosphopantothenate--cysteine ligase CoaBC [Candidatus Bathyarchaeota archaeon]